MPSHLKNENLPKSGLPWHGWILGGIFLLYSLAAAFDSAMSFIQGVDYFKASGMNEMQISYFSNLPFLATLGMTVCIWGGLLASIGLLMRKPISARLFFIAVVSNFLYLIYVYLLSDGIAAMGVLWPMPIVITVMMIGMIFYCRRLTSLTRSNAQ
jgi:hypothetical protein